MQDIASTLANWRDEGRRLIPEHWGEFRRLVAVADDLMQRKQYAAAAAYGELAALYAISRHCGLFVSPALERVLIAIGQQAFGEAARPVRRSSQYPPRHVLHVSTRVMPVGGHSRMIWRWIQQDEGRTHSLALTRQTSQVPAMLRHAVASSGGRLYRVNRAVGGLIAWARQLREVAANVDLVVLHSFNDDVIPLIALACRDRSPPVIFLDHADHIFWLGAGISDVVVSLRESGMRLAQQRRGILPERSLLLPTVVMPAERLHSREEAKRRIGLPEDSVLLLSIARPLKYGAVGNGSYADAHVPILDRYKNAWLIVVGPQDRPDWSAAVHRTQGRIIQVSEREDTALYYEAADIYIDSFPFVSTTSLLEAGGYGVPLVSIFPYSETSGTLGADMPGLDGNLIRVGDLRDYDRVLSELIEEERYRRELGERTREKILKVHTGIGWQIRLENIYRRACHFAAAHGEPMATEEMFTGEPDVYIPRIHGHAEHSESRERDLDRMIESLIRIMPIDERMRQWIRLASAAGGFRNADRVASLKYLIPEWLIGRIKSDPWRGVGAAR
jgi:glycosyltransferase involved in cell wall biosynthesis